MTRTLTDPNSDDILEWTEKASDVNGDQVTTSLELDAVDDGTGFTQRDTDVSNVSWLSYSTRTNLKASGTRETFLDIEADATALQVGYDYRFEVSAFDGVATTTRKFVLTITSPVGKTVYTTQYDSVKSFNVDPAFDITGITSKNQSSTLGRYSGDAASMINVPRWDQG